MQLEIHKLQSELYKNTSHSVVGDDGLSFGPAQPGSVRYNELRRQLDDIKVELIQSETAREDLRSKTLEQEREILILQQKNDELNKHALDLSLMKDELDDLREASEKLKISEALLSTYKKKMEDYNDLKKQIKFLEERSVEYLRQITEFEEDSRKYCTLKGQVDLYKNEIKELHGKLDSEMSRIVKLEFDNKQFECQVNALKHMKDNLLSERDLLRENVDELQCGRISDDNRNTVSKELLPPKLTDKIERLEVENKALREGHGGQTALAQLLDDANQRNENLRLQLHHLNEKVLLLTLGAQSNDSSLKEVELATQVKQVIELNEQKTTHLEEAQSQLVIAQRRLAEMGNTISSKEQELLSCDLKYRKCVDKAKEVIKSIDSKISNGAALDVLFFDKNFDKEIQCIAGITIKEENLLATAFYRLGLKYQRDSVESKLNVIMGQGHSFLSRQRQSGLRKSFMSCTPK